MARRWRGVLVREGEETGDHRIFLPGAWEWRDLPLTFRVQFEEGSWGHENAIAVGSVDLIERRGADIYGEGPLAEGDADAERWWNLNQQGCLQGVSVDWAGGDVTLEAVNKETGEVLDPDIAMEVLWSEEGENYYVREVWSRAEFAAATAVGVPAFSTTRIETYDDAEAEVAAQPETAPPAARSTVGGQAAAIDDLAVDVVVSWTDAEGEERTGTVVAVDAEAETVTVQPYDDEGNEVGDPVVLAVAEVSLVDAPEAPEAPAPAAAAYPALAARMPINERPALSALLARSQPDVVHASARRSGGAVVQASVAWDGGPPAEWFADLDLTEPTPLTITDDGEVYGHIALWGTCHAGFAAGQFSDCVMPEPSPTGYALFHNSGQVRCDDGTRARVGVLAMDCGHAPAGRPGRRPSVASVQAFYEQTGLQAAWLRAHDGPIGPEVHGVLRSGIAVDDVRRAMASRPSGDWRDQGHGLDLLGLVQVNVPAYPVYEIEDDRTVVLMASLSPPPGVTLRSVAAAQDAAAASCDGTCGCSGACRGGGEHAARYAALRQSPKLRLASLDRDMHSRASA